MQSTFFKRRTDNNQEYFDRTKYLSSYDPHKKQDREFKIVDEYSQKYKSTKPILNKIGE